MEKPEGKQGAKPQPEKSAGAVLGREDQADNSEDLFALKPELATLGWSVRAERLQDVGS